MGLPRGALITRLVKRNNIDLATYRLQKIKAGTTLNKASFENMHYELKSSIWTKKGDQPMEQRGDEDEGDVDQSMEGQEEKGHRSQS
ncbi:hypothetical protein SLEP1_g43034 [Rubroshorea leprosula]|uniref:Uncharacterized protein n=1 Tax=Rubroshorea leprosula TaxID=152421 RepID=A0AAV5LCA2_9ROSI|nr:hypothetical protein SLEP1_g43034 [Rubroshorea leprosula]